MNTRKYFYKDEEGKIQKLYYCSRCSTNEAFKKSDMNTAIIKISDNSYLCKKCSVELNLKEVTSRFFALDGDLDKSIDVLDDVDENLELQLFDETPRVIEKKAKVIVEPIPEVKEIVESLKKKQESIEDNLENVQVSETEIETKETDKVKFFAYVVKCNDGTYYCATTTDVDKAVKNHNKCSGSDYTRKPGRRPVVLVESKQASDIIEAKKMKIELQGIYKSSS